MLSMRLHHNGFALSTMVILRLSNSYDKKPTPKYRGLPRPPAPLPVGGKLRPGGIPPAINPLIVFIFRHL